MRKRIFVLGITFLTAMLMTACYFSDNESEIMRDRDYLGQKINFATSNFFENNQALVSHDLFDRMDQTALGESNFTFIFVYDIEEITNPTEDMIIFFPTEMTLGRVELANYLVRRNDLDLTEFSLAYPLTLEDFVYNRENVADLWLDGFSSAQVSTFSVQLNSFSIDYQARRLEELELTEEDERLYYLLRYGQGMWFGHNQDMRFMDMRREVENGDHSFSDVVFVHNEDEASNFPSDVIVFFPTEETLIVLEWLNRDIERREQYQVTLADLGLNQNLTAEDTINEGESVSLFWQSIDPRHRTWSQRMVLYYSGN